jgi:type VI secretion system secreted protein Hcp
MATDIFLSVDGVKGETTDDKHAEEIAVLSFKFGADNKGTAATNLGTGAGKVQVDDLLVRKYLDKSSPNLFLFCCNGKPIKQCKLTVRKAGEKPLEFAVYTLDTCMVSSVKVVGPDETDQIVEEVMFNFAKIKYEYNPQDPATGGGKGVVATTWDVAKSKAG